MQDCCNFVFETLLHGEWAYLERENYKYPIPSLIVLILAGSSTYIPFWSQLSLVHHNKLFF